MAGELLAMELSLARQLIKYQFRNMANPRTSDVSYSVMYNISLLV
jgi:hypothetical protein